MGRKRPPRGRGPGGHVKDNTTKVSSPSPQPENKSLNPEPSAPVQRARTVSPDGVRHQPLADPVTTKGGRGYHSMGGKDFAKPPLSPSSRRSSQKNAQSDGQSGDPVSVYVHACADGSITPLPDFLVALADDNCSSVHFEGKVTDAQAVAVFPALNGNPAFREVELGSGELSPVGIPPLVSAIETNTCITYLNLSGNAIRSEGLSLLAAGLASNGSVIRLDLRSNGIGNHGAAALAELLSHQQCILRAVDLSRNRIKCQGASRLALALKVNSKLESINLRFNQISDSGASAIGTSLGSNHTLIDLDLGGNTISDRGAASVVHGLATNDTLRSLSLRANQLGNEGARLVGGLLRSATCGIETLSLGANAITTEGCAFLVGSLKQNATLVKLHLPGCRFASQGAAHISSMLRTNSTLQELIIDLAMDRDDTDGLAMIADALRSNTTLLKLALGPSTAQHAESVPLRAIAQKLKLNRFVAGHGDNVGDVDTSDDVPATPTKAPADDSEFFSPPPKPLAFPRVSVGSGIRTKSDTAAPALAKAQEASQRSSHQTSARLNDIQRAIQALETDVANLRLQKSPSKTAAAPVNLSREPEFMTLSREQEELKEDLKTVAERLATIEAESVTSQENTQQSLESQFAALVEENGHLKASFDEKLKAEVEKVQLEFNAQFAALREEFLNHLASSQTAKSDVKQAKNDKFALKSDVDVLRRDIANLQSIQDKSKVKGSPSRAAPVPTRSEFVTLAEMDAMRSEVARVESAQEKLEQDQSNMKVTLDEISENHMSRAEFHTLTEVYALRDQLNELSDRCDQAESKSSQPTQVLDLSNYVTNKDLQVELKNKVETLNLVGLRQKVADVSHLHAKRIDDLEDRITELGVNQKDDESDMGLAFELLEKKVEAVQDQHTRDLRDNVEVKLAALQENMETQAETDRQIFGQLDTVLDLLDKQHYEQQDLRDISVRIDELEISAQKPTSSPRPACEDCGVDRQRLDRVEDAVAQLSVDMQEGRGDAPSVQPEALASLSKTVKDLAVTSKTHGDSLSVQLSEVTSELKTLRGDTVYYKDEIARLNVIIEAHETALLSASDLASQVADTHVVIGAVSEAVTGVNARLNKLEETSDLRLKKYDEDHDNLRDSISDLQAMVQEAQEDRTWFMEESTKARAQDELRVSDTIRSYADDLRDEFRDTLSRVESGMGLVTQQQNEILHQQANASPVPPPADPAVPELRARVGELSDKLSDSLKSSDDTQRSNQVRLDAIQNLVSSLEIGTRSEVEAIKTDLQREHRASLQSLEKNARVMYSQLQAEIKAQISR